MLPPDEDPASFDWRPVAGLDVVLVETGGTPLGIVRTLAEELIQAGSPLVVISGIDPAEPWIYRPLIEAAA